MVGISDIAGICEDCVIGVDLARGVTIWVAPGKVFKDIGCIGTYSPSKEASLYCGSIVALFTNHSVAYTELTIHGPIYSIHSIYGSPISIGQPCQFH